MKKLFVLIVLLFAVIGQSQESKTNTFKLVRTGVLLGYGDQHKPIWLEEDYTYNYRSIKWSNHIELKAFGNLKWELLLEPAYYRTNFTLLELTKYVDTTNPLNPWLLNQLGVTQEMNEFVLNVGNIARYQINTIYGVYVVCHSGATYVDTKTARQDKGFAFNNVLGIGGNYTSGNFMYDLKIQIRHLSNANTHMPNFGYDALGVDIGVYYRFN